MSDQRNLLSRLFLILSSFGSAVNAQEGLDLLILHVQREFDNRFCESSFRFSVTEKFLFGPAWSEDDLLIWDVAGVCKRNREGMLIEHAGFEKNLLFCKRDEVMYKKVIALGETILDPFPVKWAMVVAKDSSLLVDSNGPDDFQAWGTVKSNNSRFRWAEVGNCFYYRELNFLFGHTDPYGAKRFSDLVASANLAGEVMLNGAPCWLFELKSDQGDVRFWYKKNPQPALAQVEVELDSGDYWAENIRLTEIGGWWMNSEAPRLTALKYRYSEIKYDEIESKLTCVGFRFDRYETYADGAKSESRRTVKLKDISLNAPEIPSHSLDFETFSVPDMTRFGAKDSPNIPYVVAGGRIAKVVDENTLQSVNGATFAMPQKNRILYGMASCLVLGSLIAAFIFYKRSRRHDVRD